MLHYSLVVLIGLSGSLPAFADPGLDGLVTEPSKDFGAVPRGAVLVHPFSLHNTSSVPVHVMGLRVSCGCVTARMEHPDLAPGQSAAVVAEMHTDRFLGDKVVTVYVQLDRPDYREIALQVRARSCEDVMLSPEMLEFGRVAQGSTPRAQTTVSLPGNGAWQVLKASSDSAYVHLAIQEVASQSGRMYQLQATLDSELPPGKWFTEIWLHTNHPWMERVRLPVQVVVEPLLSVSPPYMSLEAPASGQRAQKKVLVHGTTPFAIVAVKGGDEHWKVHDETPGRAAQHVLTVTCDGPVASPQERTFQVVTDLPQGTVEFQLRAEAAGSR